MLGRGCVDECARRGRPVLVLWLQRCRSGLWRKVCSAFLEGKGELRVKNDLLSVGLSASCVV